MCIQSSRYLFLGDEAKERGVALTPSQRAIVSCKIRVMLAWVKQRDLVMAEHVFAGLVDELRTEFERDETGGDGAQGDATHVSHLGLSLREGNSLEQHGVETVADLRAKLATKDGRLWLLSIPTFGPVVLSHLFTALDRFDKRQNA